MYSNKKKKMNDVNCSSPLTHYSFKNACYFCIKHSTGVKGVLKISEYCAFE